MFSWQHEKKWFNISPKNFSILGLIFISYFAVHSSADLSDDVTFQFHEYDYKETSKNELSYREFESACDQSKRCEPLSRIARIRCVRECISPSCYQEIYEFDELEEGEIDVRLNSFKGCFIQRLGRSRNR